VGCILNGVLSEHHPYYYHRYGKDAYYYGEDEKRKRKVGSHSEVMTRTERLKALKDPDMAFVSEGWKRFMDLSKGHPTKNTKDSDGHS